jgi:hypothetical protein
MSGEEKLSSVPDFEYVNICLRAIDERRYHDALTSLEDGITKQLASQHRVNSADLLKHFRTLISYLDFRLGEDFGSQWEVQPNVADENEIRCSFCGKKEPEVKRIIAGPGVFICNECIQICADTLARDLAST